MAELEDARFGFLRRLRRKGFSREFISNYAEELFAQAQLELLQALSRDIGIHSPPAWLIHCAWRRTQSLLDTQRRLPSMVAVDRVAPLRSEASTPEEEVLAVVRDERLHDGIRCLPQAERAVVGAVYYKQMSCREAGRTLGWGQAKANRRHHRALRRLEPFLQT